MILVLAAIGGFVGGFLLIVVPFYWFFPYKFWFSDWIYMLDAEKKYNTDFHKLWELAFQEDIVDRKEDRFGQMALRRIDLDRYFGEDLPL